MLLGMILGVAAPRWGAPYALASVSPLTRSALRCERFDMRGRTGFTKKLQAGVAKRLEGYLDGFRVEEEYPCGDGRFDICALRGRDRIVIEIEHWSEPRQAQRNIDKAHEEMLSEGGRWAFIHAVNGGGNVDARGLEDPRDGARWWCRRHKYTHEKDDMVSSTGVVIDSFFDRRFERFLTEAVGFVRESRVEAMHGRAVGMQRRRSRYAPVGVPTGARLPHLRRQGQATAGLLQPREGREAGDAPPGGMSAFSSRAFAFQGRPVAILHSGDTRAPTRAPPASSTVGNTAGIPRSRSR
jgi:hypothetical protein